MAFLPAKSIFITTSPYSRPAATVAATARESKPAPLVFAGSVPPSNALGLTQQI
jgi:hypothetical protein